MKLKHLILVFSACLLMALNSCSRAQAGLFGSGDSDARARLSQVEGQLSVQRQSTGNWQQAAFLVAIGAIVLFNLGTALGAKIRRHASANRS